MEALHGGFPAPWRRPPAWLGPAGRQEYQRILRRLSSMRGERPPLDRGRLIEHCESVDRGDHAAASKLVFAMKWFDEGRRPKPLAGRPRLVVDNTQAPENAPENQSVFNTDCPSDDADGLERAHAILDRLEARQRQSED